MKLRVLCKFLLAQMLSASCLLAGLPQWLDNVVESRVAKEESEHDAYVLYDWGHLDYSQGGKHVSNMRYAVQIMSPDERQRASVSIHYQEGDERVRKFRAWIIEEDGKTYDFKGSDLVEMATSMDNLFAEGKKLVLNVSDSVRPGCIFAYEYQKRETTLFTQSTNYIQASVPKNYYRLIIETPSRWDVRITPINNPAGSELRTEDSVIWEARDIEPFVDEDYGPVLDSVRGFLGIDFVPLDESVNRKGLFSFDDWADVAAFAGSLGDPSVVVDESIQAKAVELTAGAQSDWDRIRAVAEYAQSVNYVAMTADINQGGGYKPFPAPEVLERHYGDCKDMTVLTRALLAAVGIESYSVSANVGEGTLIHEDWPSPLQFDHCIVAIEPPEGLDLEAVVEHPDLGRLLLFDPTLQAGPIGETPSYIQGSSVLIDNERVNGLQRIPENDPRRHFRRRNISIRLEIDGTIAGSVEEINHGNRATRARSVYRNRTREEFTEMWKHYIAADTRDASIDDLQVEDRFYQGQFVERVDFVAPYYAKSMRGRLLVFKPVILSRYDWVPSTTEERRTPFLLAARYYEERTEVDLPLGFVVDEMGAPVRLETTYGIYTSNIRVDGDELVLERTMQWNKVEVPPEEFGELVDFYEGIVSAEKTPVVLIRS